MTKTIKWVCAQRRLRSAWASAQSDQSIRCSHKESLGPYRPTERKRRLWSDWADAQADLSLRWAHTYFVGFVMSRLIHVLHCDSHYGETRKCVCKILCHQPYHMLVPKENAYYWSLWSQTGKMSKRNIKVTSNMHIIQPKLSDFPKRLIGSSKPQHGTICQISKYPTSNTFPKILLKILHFKSSKYQRQKRDITQWIINVIYSKFNQIICTFDSKCVLQRMSLSQAVIQKFCSQCALWPKSLSLTIGNQIFTEFYEKLIRSSA